MSSSTIKLYDELVHIDDELAGIRKDSKWGIIRVSDGTVLLEIEYDKLTVVNKNLLYVVSNSNGESSDSNKIYYGYVSGRLFPASYRNCKIYPEAIKKYKYRGYVYATDEGTYISRGPLRLLVFGGYEEYTKKMFSWCVNDLISKSTKNAIKNLESKPEKSDYIPEHTYLVKGKELVFEEEIKMTSFDESEFAIVTVGNKVTVVNMDGEHSDFYSYIRKDKRFFLTWNDKLRGVLTFDFRDPCGAIFDELEVIEDDLNYSVHVNGYVYLSGIWHDVEGYPRRDCDVYRIYPDGKFEKFIHCSV